MTEIKIDRNTLPKDGEFVIFKTQGEIEHKGAFCEGDDLFVKNPSKWFLSWQVTAWESLKIDWEFVDWAEKECHEANIKGIDNSGGGYEAIGIIGIDMEIDEVRDVEQISNTGEPHKHKWIIESNTFGVSRRCECGEYQG